jgi:hypothetical protein
MQRLFLTVLLFLGIVPGQVSAQGPIHIATDGAVPFVSGDGAVPMAAFAAPAEAPSIPVPVVAVLPRMAPELALQAYENRWQAQAGQLASYSANTLIHAQLPGTAQSGEYELERHYAAPRTLEFKAVRFTGDGFVKSNVITRLLQSEVDHVQKDDASLTALTPANYKFSYKGTSETEGRLVHVYQVKPHKKRAGLFKGKIFLDSRSGSLVHAEGSVIKSPSFFIKKIEFVQDYADVGPFTFPVHIHTEANTRLVGRAVVDIYQRDYQPVANPVQTAQVPAL